MAPPSGGRCILLLLGRRDVLWLLVERGVGGRRETNGAVDGRCILLSIVGKRKMVGSSSVSLSWVLLEAAVTIRPTAVGGLSSVVCIWLCLACACGLWG